jgi:hypothetical protein
LQFVAFDPPWQELARLKNETREWDQRHGKPVDLSAFQRDILPLIQNIPLSQLQRARGLSVRCASLIRHGERTPHRATGSAW